MIKGFIIIHCLGSLSVWWSECKHQHALITNIWTLCVSHQNFVLVFIPRQKKIKTPEIYHYKCCRTKYFALGYFLHQILVCCCNISGRIIKLQNDKGPYFYHELCFHIDPCCINIGHISKMSATLYIRHPYRVDGFNQELR